MCPLFSYHFKLFFKWIKQNLRIKTFYGTSENAVKSQIWIAITTYLLVAILKKRLELTVSRCTILPVLSVSVFEKTSINQQLQNSYYRSEPIDVDNQLKLFS